MTIEELIMKLQKYPSDTPVCIHQWLFDIEEGEQYPADIPISSVELHKDLGKEYILIHGNF